ncbi:hypothetical protein FRC01_004205 [Tulasnella sp. 417]|nr:hypothetical protein FRC01_004205 [Tulasnella sp. 417]
MEIFIDLDISDPPDPTTVTVSYYMVDHRSRQIFWNSNVQFSAIGIPPCEYKGHLKSFLTTEYWVHVDYFPAHMTFDENFSDAERELMDILGHGAVDEGTAPGSTCIWAASECSDYRTVLRDFRIMDENTSYRIATIARIWTAVGRARHINCYGLPNALLDRLQGLVALAPAQLGFQTAIHGLAVLCLFISLLRQMPVLLDGLSHFRQALVAAFPSHAEGMAEMYSPSIATVLYLVITILAFL